MPPFMAQGGALALEDAIVLSNLLKQGDWDNIAELFTTKRAKRVIGREQKITVERN